MQPQRQAQEHNWPQRAPQRSRMPSAGFTLVEVMVTMIILALIVNVAYQSFDTGVDDARFQTSRANQSILRRAISQYQSRTQTFPPSLETLTRKYINRVPDDPLTSFVGNDWLMISPSGDPSNPTSWTTNPPPAGIFDICLLYTSPSPRD